jgi:plastocyanin
LPKRSVSIQGIFISLVIAIVLIVGSVYGIGVGSAGAHGKTHFLIDMTDYQFTPSTITWHVGDTVTLTVRNASDEGVVHEFMIGRNPNEEDQGFGKTITDGFETDFFKNMDVKLISGSRILMVQPGPAHLSGINPKKVLASDPPGLVQDGDQFQIVFATPVRGENPEPGGTLTFQLKVPNEPGKWEMACYQGDGQHIKNGMEGTINIVK